MNPVSPRPRVDFVVPLSGSHPSPHCAIRRLHAHLAAGFPWEWRIVIADGSGASGTGALAAALTGRLDGVSTLTIDPGGRRAVLRAALQRSDADVVACVEPGAGGDLRALAPLVAPLISGHSDLAVCRAEGETLGARVLGLVTRASLGGARGPFKALRADAARRLLTAVADDGGFFDGELLIAAHRHGMRVHEVVDDRWVPADRRTGSVTDLRAAARLAFDGTPQRFCAIGVASTLAHALLFLLLRGPLGSLPANALSLGVCAVANTQANRWWAFRMRGRDGLARQHAAGALVYLLALGLTDGALAVLGDVDPRASRLLEVSVLVLASLAATLTRYVALRTWVFARAARVDAPAGAGGGL